jgi:phenylpropionate dioxygenase-like ring-hydroxylating dioxygenase large terminal subunit
MITAEENEILTRVGKGTPMGELMRQFWVPACLSSELKAGGDPMRLMLLGEKLVAFRSPDGRAAIMDHLCPHRCASLFFGRNEDGGIRCAYHGWKFDADGNCLDQPNLPEKNRYLAGTKAKAYKVAERAGIVFLYMGERAVPPPLPGIEATIGEYDDSTIALTHRECNWLQNLEGDIDTSHLGFLHSGGLDGESLHEDSQQRWTIINKAPHIAVAEMPFGTMYSAYRDAKPGMEHHRMAAFIFPFWVTYPNGDEISTNIAVNAWVPVDDNNTMIFNIDRFRGKRDTNLKYKDGTPVKGVARPLEYLPQTTDWMGRWRSAKNRTNDYGIDREWQRRDSFTGISGIPLQDHAIIESMGPIVDRTLEHPASSDRMVVVTRRALIEAAMEYKNTGKLPAVVDQPELSLRARGGDVMTPKGTDWLEAHEQAMQKAIGWDGNRIAAE